MDDLRLGRRVRAPIPSAWPPGEAARRGPATPGSAGSGGTRRGLLAELVGRQRRCVAQVVPEVQVGEEVRVLVREFGRAPGRACCLLRPAARAGPGCESAAAITSTSRDAAVRGRPRASSGAIRGSTGSRASLRPSGVSSRSARRSRPAPAAAATPSRDRALVRRLEEREILDVAEPERLHLQDDAGEIRAQDLRIGELRARQRSPPRSTAGCRCPRDTRPQRPLRWSALACETGSIGSRCTFGAGCSA